MRTGLLVVASLAAAIAGANAAELSGTIKSIDFAKDAIDESQPDGAFGLLGSRADLG